MKEDKKIEILEAIIFLVSIIAVCVIFVVGFIPKASAQTTWTFVKNDTIVSSNIRVTEYTKRDGSLCIKAKWCDKAVTVSQKDGNAILEGDTAAVIIVTYKVDGYTITEPKKVIAINMRRGR